MRIYLDLVIALNLLVDFLLLLGTNRLSGFPANTGRCMVASICGGVYGGVCLLPGFRFLSGILWRIVFLGFIGVVAFGIRLSSLRRTCLFVILSMAMGGMSLSVNNGNLFFLMGAACGIWILCALAFREPIGAKKFLPLTLRYRDRTVTVSALQDTGNCLRDPVTGEHVYLIGPEISQQLTGLSVSQLRDPYGTLMNMPIPGLRLIPYHAVGNNGGMLLGLRLDYIELDGRVRRAVVAFVPEGLGTAGDYQALVCAE